MDFTLNEVDPSHQLIAAFILLDYHKENCFDCLSHEVKWQSITSTMEESQKNSLMISRACFGRARL